MDNFTISEDSAVVKATVDKKRLVLGGKPVALTESQITRLQDAGVTLDKHSTNDS